MNHPSASGPISSNTLELSSQQKRLEEELRKIAPKLADCYIGVIQVFSQTTIASRIILAAHGIREILEKLPEHVSTLPVQNTRSHKDLAQELFKVWRTLDPKWPGTPPWFGELDGSLQRFLLAFEKYEQDYDLIAPKRRQKTAAFLNEFNPSNMPLPEPIETERVSAYDRIRDYFVYTSHQRKSPTSEDFEKKLAEFEYFLMDLIKPKPFDNQNEIDAIIREAEQ